MKKLIILLAPLLALVFVTCDKVKNPIVPKSSAVGSNFVTKNNASVSGFKKTLLEDYTGMRCPNCPAAVPTVTNLTAQYGNSLVVIAVHAGGFAKPVGAYANQDFRTDAGEKWISAQGFLISSYPSGLINRKNYGGGVAISAHTGWPAAVSQSFSDPFVLKLDVTTNFDTTVKALNIAVKGTFRSAVSNTVMIIAGLIEEGQSGLQDVAGVETEDYEWEHMFRGTLNGEWGTVLKNGPSAANDSVKVSFDNIDLKALKFTIDYPDPTPDYVHPYTLNDKETSVVVFAYDATTREVLQVEKVKIR